VHLAIFLSGGFNNMAVMNPLEKKLEKLTSVHFAVARVNPLNRNALVNSTK
jgi:hypothetical protein